MKNVVNLSLGLGLSIFLAIGYASACEDLFLQNEDEEIVNGTVYTTRGALLILVCDGTCQGAGFTPNLKWYTPSGEKVSTFPGRIMSVYQQSRRSRKLYVQRFRWRDQGTYSCEGQIHGEFRKSSVKVLIRGTSIRPVSQRSDRETTETPTDVAEELPLLPDTIVQ
ncbi:uncharacterized protein [Haliotis cracherodii]|uniref:uncharacterized protein LOC124110757 n=1 Tax=Haliotis rufescens TaxID=6454 RepID=UPI001EB007CF|nr:uncharacterized protein LOC124110757 [Haliotis rufescens]